MSAKTLSNGTLSLRFMQNAHRAKNLAEVEADRASIQDEAKWEVSKEVKEAWGLLNSLPPPTVTYETSYIPFLFHVDASQSPSPSKRPNLRGRRTFNKRGEEITEEPRPPTPDPVVKNEEDKGSPELGSRASRRPLTKIKSSPDSTESSNAPSHFSKGTSHTVQQLIRSNPDIGTDLRRPPANWSTGTFMKPSGVDDPVPRSHQSEQETIPGARIIKRDLESPSEQSEVKKRKKRKNPETV